jgi:WD40 repeat protein
MAKTFDINKHARKADLLALTVENTKFASFHKKSADAGLVAFEDALQNDEFTAASDFLKATQQAAEAGKELGLLKKATTASERLALRKGEWEQFEKARENLTNKPDDPESNQTVGNYLCFTKGLWSRGVFFLSKSSNPKVSSLASIELGRKTSVDTRMNLADSWFSLAEESDEGVRPQIRDRACYWYRAVAPNLSGLSQQRVDQLLRTHDQGFRSVPRNWKLVQSIDGESEYDIVYGGALSPDGKLFAGGDPSHGMRLWDVETGKLRREIKGHLPGATEVMEPVFLKDGKRFLVVFARHHLAEIYGIDSGKPLNAFPNDPNSLTSKLVVSPNEDLLITTGSTASQGIVTLWSVQTSKQIRRIEHGLVETKFPGPFVAFCADGKRIACGSQESMVVSICDCSTGQQVGTLTGHTGNVFAIATGRVGKFIATAGRDGTVRLWSASSEKQLRQLSVDKASVKPIGIRPDDRTLAMSPDERLIATGLDDGSVVIWDSETGRQLNVLKTEFSHIHWITFSLNGQRLATSGDKAKHLIWKAEF